MAARPDRHTVWVIAKLRGNGAIYTLTSRFDEAFKSSLLTNAVVFFKKIIVCCDGKSNYSNFRGMGGGGEIHQYGQSCSWRGRISENWDRPPSARRNMRTLLKITLTRAGKVQNVQIVDTSGDRAFDLSAKEATLKSEFPEIKELSPSEYTKYFREINILFDPQNLRL